MTTHNCTCPSGDGSLNWPCPAHPAGWSDASQSELNDWFLSLPDGRQAALREDKWMLAASAFLAGKHSAAPSHPPAQGVGLTDDQLTDIIAAGLSCTYHCTRVWEAWSVGTMSQYDFEPVDVSDTPGEIAQAIRAAIAQAPASEHFGWHWRTNARASFSASGFTELRDMAELLMKDEHYIVTPLFAAQATAVTKEQP